MPNTHEGLTIKTGWPSLRVGIPKGLTAGLLALWTCLCLTACIRDEVEDSITTTQVEAAQISFTVNLANAYTRTDTYSDDYDSADANSYETTVSSLQVFLYDTDGQFLTEVEQNTFVASSSTGGLYVFTGTLTDTSAFTVDNGVLTFSGRVMLLANCDTYTPTASNDTLSLANEELGNLTYTFSNPNDGGTRSAGIPMWGVASVSNVSLYAGICTMLSDEIDLLRAMAKVVLQIGESEDDDEGTYTITAASVSGYNTSGYCLPIGYSEVDDTDDLALECLHLPDGVSLSTSSLAFTVSDETAIIYLPEIANTATSPTISVDITRTVDGTETGNSTETLYFQEYTDGQATGTAYDLVRNHVYTYTLTKTIDTELYVEWDTTWYDMVTSSVGWEVDDKNVTFQAAVKSGSTTGDTDAIYSVLTYPRWSDDDHTETADSKSYASYEFILNETAKFATGTITWQAYLTNEEYFQFNTNSNESDIGRENEYNVTTGVNRDKSYTIKVGPYKLSSDGSNQQRWNDYDITTTDEDGNETTTTIPGIKWDIDGDYVIREEGSDTIIAVYTDLFILATGSGLTYPLKINKEATDDDALFTPNVFPGGTKDIFFIDENSKHLVLPENKWLRIYWTCADTRTGYNGYDDVLEKITDASSDDEKWFKTRRVGIDGKASERQ